MTKAENIQKPEYVFTAEDADNWLYNGTIGNSTRSELYLAFLRDLRTQAKAGGEQTAKILDETHMLTAALSSATEFRLGQSARENEDSSSIEIPGVTPLREVDERDIVGAGSQFDPMYSQYQDPAPVYLMHQTINAAVDAELNRPIQQPPV